MKRLAIGIVVAAALFSPVPPAAAQVPFSGPPLVFVTVDAVRTDYARIYITGILENTAAPVERYANFAGSGDMNLQVLACEKLALLAMARPGQYRLELSWTSVSSISTNSCKLVRVVP